MLDLILAVRADEASHRSVSFSLPFPALLPLQTDKNVQYRFVNHSFANLNLSTKEKENDVNPFGLVLPSKSVQGSRVGFTRDESLEWARDVRERVSGEEEAKQEKKLREGGEGTEGKGEGDV